jgi:hypothetical protein
MSALNALKQQQQQPAPNVAGASPTVATRVPDVTVVTTVLDHCSPAPPSPRTPPMPSDGRRAEVTYGVGAGGLGAAVGGRGEAGKAQGHAVTRDLVAYLEASDDEGDQGAQGALLPLYPGGLGPGATPRQEEKPTGVAEGSGGASERAGEVGGGWEGNAVVQRGVSVVTALQQEVQQEGPAIGGGVAGGGRREEEGFAGVARCGDGGGLAGGGEGGVTDDEVEAMRKKREVCVCVCVCVRVCWFGSCRLCTAHTGIWTSFENDIHTHTHTHTLRALSRSLTHIGVGGEDGSAATIQTSAATARTSAKPIILSPPEIGKRKPKCLYIACGLQLSRMSCEV